MNWLRGTTLVAFATTGWLSASSHLQAAELAPPTGVQVASHLQKHLLLDNRIVESADNGILAVGDVIKHRSNPLFGETLPWETSISHMYASVVFDKEDNLYKCWYYTKIKDWGKDVTPEWRRARNEPYTAICYATSQDGIHWQKPLLPIFRYKEQPTNLVFMDEGGTGIFKDTQETDPARRYKMFLRNPSKPIPHKDVMAVSFSADGLHWSEPKVCPEINAVGDTHNNALWVPELKKYVGITRLWKGDLKKVSERQRLVGRTESEDFLQWTEAMDVGLGTGEAQVYSMPIFAYANVYLGLPAIYTERSDRRVRTELTWSPDTISWHSIENGKQFIPLSEDRDSYEWGCIYAAAAPVVLEDEIRIYYSAQPSVHGWNPGSLCVATLPLDRWAGYLPQDPTKPAIVTTKPLTVDGTRLFVNVDAEDGEIAVEVLDQAGKIMSGFTQSDCDILRTDKIRQVVTWNGNADLSALKGQMVQFRFIVKGSRLYSFYISADPAG